MMMSILEALSVGSTEQPDRPAWTFLNDKGDPVDNYTYKVTNFVVENCALLAFLIDNYVL
jgi:hypothetical protein